MKNNNYYKKVLVHHGSYFTSSISKTKITFFTIVLLLYLFLYTWSSFTCVNCKEDPSKTFYPDLFSVAKTNHDNDDKPTKTSKGIGPSEIDLSKYNLRNMGFASSSEELEFLLNIRKLILFAVHELNKPLKETRCVKWWANPLDLISHKEISKSDNYTNHKIKFIIQPGNIIHLQVEIKQQNAPINVNDTELKVVGLYEFFNAPSGLFGLCDKETLSVDIFVERTCICPDREEVPDLEQATEVAIKIWNSVDSELPTWKPKHSFMVGDYINFTDYEWFVKSPGNTKNEVSHQNFSQEYCGPNLKMLVMISSAPMHFKHRKIIRETFASPENLKGKGIKVVFLMGIPTDESINAEVITEEENFKDIIVANFEDSYHNLTLSHLSMYKWIQLTCGNGKSEEVTLPKFLLKADDDFLLNVDLALKVAEANPDVELMGVLFCGRSFSVVRSTSKKSASSKYYTPKHMHISKSYSGYFHGVAYLLRTEVIPRFLHMSITTPFIHMDDVYVTGILSRKLEIHRRNSKLFTWKKITKPDACNIKAVVNSYVKTPEDMTAQWNLFLKPMPSNCASSKLDLKVDPLVDSVKIKCLFEK